MLKAKPPQLCPRCQGKMFPTGDGSDFACFSCGHVVYPVIPAALLPDKERKPSHGGVRLS